MLVSAWPVIISHIPIYRDTAMHRVVVPGLKREGLVSSRFNSTYTHIQGM